ncbi:recombinase family protein (plasmid) [Rhizobium sp. CB3171]|uniref:recombinase family protein n=1 Tax=Rhizobium sp. CB3171 TaxID=3039157 RepID=UPI0024B08A9E|nr:recombinase family protein [Rhizobium sp. CB3171]WFU07553.1 recombinase family protein [Rhizobium sp. CB3171]
MIYGYARVSTKKQDLAYQLERLRKAGCDRIIEEKKSAKDTQGRPEFLRLLAALEPGDTLVATVSDRVARDPLDMLLILREVKTVGAKLRLLDEPLDSESGIADLTLYMYGWAGQQYRLRLLENTANGREIAKAKGVRFGRKPKLTANQREDVRGRRLAGEPIKEIAEAFGVSESTISRVKNKESATMAYPVAPVRF